MYDRGLGVDAIVDLDESLITLLLRHLGVHVVQYALQT